MRKSELPERGYEAIHTIIRSLLKPAEAAEACAASARAR